jgi:hypothetical protein
MTANTPASRKAKGVYRQAKSAGDYLKQRSKNLSCGCVEFTAGKDRDGYGQCQDSKHAKLLGVTRAHQLSYSYHVGWIPKGVLVCHTCDNPSCINPEHLFLGTALDNNKDMNRKGRWRCGNRVREGNAPKVTKEKLDYILDSRGIKPCTVLGKELDISYSRVCQIWRGEY